MNQLGRGHAEWLHLTAELIDLRAELSAPLDLSLRRRLQRGEERFGPGRHGAHKVVKILPPNADPPSDANGFQPPLLDVAPHRHFMDPQRSRRLADSQQLRHRFLHAGSVHIHKATSITKHWQSRAISAPILGARPAVKVSFNRPYGRSHGFAEFLNYEPAFVRWAEWRGYDVSYWTDADLQRRPEILRLSRSLLCIGHDEYWTAQMVDNALAVRDAGVHLGFLGGNDVYWQARTEADALGNPDRTLICYKRANLDPRRGDPRAVSVRFVDPEVSRPQSLLTGTVYGSELSPFTQDWVVARGHWLLDGTGLQLGDTIKNLVGREYDRLGPGAITPPNLEVIAASPVTDAHGGRGVASTTLYTAPSGALVFSAATVHWTCGLTNDSPTFNPRVGQITANLLDRMASRRES